MSEKKKGYQQGVDNSSEEQEKRDPNAIEKVLISYLEEFIPAPSLDSQGAFVKTSDDIILELDEMVEIDKNTVAKIMIGLGYKTVKQFPRRFGWLMQPSPKFLRHE